jgi:acyl-CoA synthetase (AMP-forming)/AMP-acid ligase II
VAYVVLKPNQSLEERPLLAFLADRLARYKLPRRIVFREALPLSPVGKILKGALREEAAS